MINRNEQVVRSPINNSRAKQQYSFPKDERFRGIKRRNRQIYLMTSCSCDIFYDLPNTRSARSAAFGYGARPNIFRRQFSPPPNRYTLPSDFDPTLKKSCKYTFGMSREAFNKVYIKGQLYRDPVIPGPGTYNVRDVPGQRTLKYSLRPKTSIPRTQIILLYRPIHSSWPGHIQDNITDQSKRQGTLFTVWKA